MEKAKAIAIPLIMMFLAAMFIFSSVIPTQALTKLNWDYFYGAGYINRYTYNHGYWSFGTGYTTWGYMIMPYDPPPIWVHLDGGQCRTVTVTLPVGTTELRVYLSIQPDNIYGYATFTLYVNGVYKGSLVKNGCKTVTISGSSTFYVGITINDNQEPAYERYGWQYIKWEAWG